MLEGSGLRALRICPRAGFGPFFQLAREKLAANQPILTDPQIRELDQLKESTNRFHHNMNRSSDTERFNDGELVGFVTRALAFVFA